MIRNRMTKVERQELLDKIASIMAERGTVSLKELETITGRNNKQGGLTKHIKLRYKISDGLVHNVPPDIVWKPKPVDKDKAAGNDLKILIQRLIKTVERQQKEIEALQKENQRLWNSKSMPTLSERGKKVLAVFAV